MTDIGVLDAVPGLISTHTSLAGRDSDLLNQASVRIISTHTSLAGRDVPETVRCRHGSISTHTSLAGRDKFVILDTNRAIYFYSHVPRGT